MIHSTIFDLRRYRRISQYVVPVLYICEILCTVWGIALNHLQITAYDHVIKWVGIITYGSCFLTISIYTFWQVAKVWLLHIQRLYMSLTWITVVIYGCLIYLSVIQPVFFNNEAHVQIACALHELAQGRGTIGSLCHIGYPSEQFLIPSLISYFAGPSSIHLHLSVVPYFGIGFLLFYSAVCARLDRGVHGILGSIVLLLPLQFYHFIYLYLTFEQAFYPVCFMFMAMGLYMHWQRSRSLSVLSMIGMVMTWSILSYTTALTIPVLLIGLVIFDQLHVKAPWRSFLPLAMIVIMLTVLCIASYSVRGDLRLVNPERESYNIPNRIFEAYQHLYATSPTQLALMTYIGGAFLVGATSLSIGGLLGKKGILISTWVICTGVLSVTSHGYASPPVYFSLHRFVVTLPVVMYLCIELIDRYLPQLHTRYRFAFVSLWIFTLAAGSFMIHRVIHEKFTLPHPQQLIHHELFESPGRSIARVYVDQRLPSLTSYSDMLSYYTPATPFDTFDACEYVAKSTTDLDPGYTFAVILSYENDTAGCLSALDYQVDTITNDTLDLSRTQALAAEKRVTLIYVKK